MKNTLLIILLIIFAPTNAQQLEKSLLWKISGKEIKQPSYLYATIHATCDVSLEDNVKRALQQTSQLYLELKLDDPALPSIMIANSNMKDGKKITDFINKDDYVILNTFFKETIGFDLQQFQTTKPFFLLAILISKLLDCPVKSIEEQLMRISSEQRKETYGLETIKEQIDVMETIPYQYQIGELVKSAKDNMREDKMEFNELLKIYSSKDLNALLESTQKSSDQTIAKFDKTLLLDRNHNWIPRIEKIINLKPTFIGVGAAHLAGEDGIIQLLRKKGYIVEAIK